MAQIKFQDVLRDAVQLLFGTNPSAQEIISQFYPFKGQLRGNHTFEIRVLNILPQIFCKDLSYGSNQDLIQHTDFKQKTCFQMVG